MASLLDILTLVHLKQETGRLVKFLSLCYRPQSYKSYFVVDPNSYNNLICVISPNSYNNFQFSGFIYSH